MNYRYAIAEGGRIVIFKPLRRPRAAILRICWSVQAGLAVARVAEVGEEAGVWGMEPQIELCGGVKTNEYRGVAAQRLKR